MRHKARPARLGLPRPVPWRCRVCNVEGTAADHDRARRAFQRHYNATHLDATLRLSVRGERLMYAAAVVCGLALGVLSGPWVWVPA